MAAGRVCQVGGDLLESSSVVLTCTEVEPHLMKYMDKGGGERAEPLFITLGAAII